MSLTKIFFLEIWSSCFAKQIVMTKKEMFFFPYTNVKRNFGSQIDIICLK